MSLSRHCVRPIFDIDMPADDRKGESCYPVDEQEEARGAEVEEDLQGEEDSGEAAAARKVNQPRMPTAKERAMHELTHCPYRSWCEHCVRGQGSEYKHSTVVRSNVGSIPRVIMDYFFLRRTQNARAMSTRSR